MGLDGLRGAMVRSPIKVLISLRMIHGTPVETLK